MASHVATDGGTPELKSGQDGHLATSVEKGLKMKIKRKSVHSGQRHEIVSEDDAPPKAKKATKDDKQTLPRVNGSNGQTLQLQQQQVTPQNQSKPNGPLISAPESVMRVRSNETVLQRDQGTLCSSVGIVTEPDSLGVCEPGTSVLLEGIVWQETEGGVLVVNVTWRGKTYVGTLLDATRHDWAPPRLTEDNDERSRTLGFGGRAKRTGQTRTLSGSEDNNLSKLRNGKGRRSFTPVPASPGKCSSPVSADSPKVKKSVSELQVTKDKEANNGQIDRLAEEIKNNGNESKDGKGLSSGAPSSGGKVTRVMAENEDAIEEANMLKCLEPDCHKRFKQLNGLRYHQTHAHNDRVPPPPKGSSDQDGVDPVAVIANQQQTSSIQPPFDENETSKDSVCSNATTEKSETKSRDDNIDSKDKKELGRPSATCDSNTSNSVLAADSYNCNSNGASMSADESDAQNMASTADLENEMTGGAPSPAYSDISDDNNPNTSEANGSPALSGAASNPAPQKSSQSSQNGERHRSESRDASNCQNNGQPTSTAGSTKASTNKTSNNPSIGLASDEHRKDLSSMSNRMSPAVVTSASSLPPLNVPLLGGPMGMGPLVGVQMGKSGLSQPSLFPSFPSSLKLGQSIPPPQGGVQPQLLAMSHGQPSLPSPRGKNTPPSQEQRLTPKNSSQTMPNQFMPQLGSDPFSFSQTAHKRMSPSFDSRKEAGGPSPKPLTQGLPVPFGGPPPNMFLGGNPFGGPFQAPFGLEAMYHHPGYLERFGPSPGVPGGPAAQGKAALDLLQQVSVAASQQSTTNGPGSSRPSKSKTPSTSASQASIPQPGLYPGGISGTGKTKESPPPQRHLHTHHHTHVGMTYPPLYDPYAAAAMMTTPVGLHPFVPK